MLLLLTIIYTLEQHIFSYISNYAAVSVGISRVTPLVTVTMFFVTHRTIHTVTTTVDTIISVLPVITNYLRQNKCENILYFAN